MDDDKAPLTRLWGNHPPILLCTTISTLNCFGFAGSHRTSTPVPANVVPGHGDGHGGGGGGGDRANGSANASRNSFCCCWDIKDGHTIHHSRHCTSSWHWPSPSHPHICKLHSIDQKRIKQSNHSLDQTEPPKLIDHRQTEDGCGSQFRFHLRPRTRVHSASSLLGLQEEVKGKEFNCASTTTRTLCPRTQWVPVQFGVAQTRNSAGTPSLQRPDSLALAQCPCCSGSMSCIAWVGSAPGVVGRQAVVDIARSATRRSVSIGINGWSIEYEVED